MIIYPHFFLFVVETPSLALGSFEEYAAIILVALVAMWAIRKLILLSKI